MIRATRNDTGRIEGLEVDDQSECRNIMMAMIDSSRNILLIEDDSGDAELIRQMVSDVKGNYTLKTADRLSTALEILSEDAFDIVLLDLGLPDSSGLDTLSRIQSKKPGLPVIVLTGLADEELAAKAIGIGAQDYLLKEQIDGELLIRSIRYALERQKAEESLRKSEEQFGLFIQHAPAAVAMFDTDMKYILTSPRWLTDYGLVGQNIIGRSHYEVFPEIPDRWKEVHRRCMAGAVEKCEEDPFLRLNGKTDWVRWEVRPWFQSTGAIGGIIMFTEVITERKQAEEALKESQRQTTFLADLVERSSQPFAVGYPDGRLVMVNAAFSEFTGYSKEELMSVNWTHVLTAPEWQAGEKQTLGELNRTGQPVRYEQECVRKDGSRVPIEVLAHLARYEQGKPPYYYAFITDITERKRAEDALHRLNRELRAISNCNRALLRAEEERTLLNDVCRIVCEEAGYRMAWVGYAENDEAKTVRPAAWSGVEDGYLEDAGITWADRSRGRGPTGTAVRSGKSVCIQDFMTDTQAAPWREGALQRGYRSSIALPLKDENADTFGVLNIYSTAPNAFTPDENRLLEELAGNLAFGITTLRTRAERKKAEEALQQTAERVQNILESISDAFFSMDENLVITYFNRAAEQMLNRKSSEVLGMYIFDAFPEARGSVFDQKYHQAVAEKIFLEFEVYFDIEPYRNWYGVRVYPQEKGISVYFQVITERKIAEEKILKERNFSRDALDSLPGIVYLFDPEGRFLRWNRNFEEVSEYTAEEISRMSPLDFFIGQDRTLIARKIQEVFEKGAADAEADFITKSGEQKPYYYTGRMIQVEGKPCLIGMGIDIADRKQAEAAVSESRERFKNLVEASSDWVWEVDEHAVYTYASPKIRDILGYEPEEVLGKTPFDLMPPGEAGRVAAVFEEIASSQKAFSLLENVNLHKNGSRVVLETSGVPVFDNTGTFKGYRGIDRDITERKKAEETIKYQVYHDLLTGLPNRVLFADLLEHEILEMQRLRKKLAVLFLDVDQFKNINDSFGHSAGDRLIQHIAAELKNSIREFDTVARIGGDEFTLLVPLMNRPEDASKFADKVMRTFKKPFTIDHHELRLTASIGISIYPEDGQDAGSLLKNADIALHYAKDQGRDNYQFFNASLNHRTLERIIFESRLRQAVERNELVIHYQAQRNIKTGKVTGAEALVRWNHPELGMLRPAQFIPLAEEIGLIVEIDQWVLRTVCEQLKAWETAGHALPFVTANLSARQFQQPRLTGTIAAVLRETDLRPENLGIEITETLAMRDTELTTRNVNELNEMGVKLLIDDFGTGYSSLSYLKKLPIHKLKIDRSFITDLARDRDDQAITNAIVAMAHILKLKVVAEGVETKDQESFLASQNCDEMQGYLFSRPMPVEKFEKLLVLV